MAVEMTGQYKAEVKDTYHPVTFDIGFSGVDVILAGDGVNWSTSVKWEDWENIVAWMQWRRRADPHLPGYSN